MKIGIMSAAFPGLSFARVLEFLSSNIFGSIEVACWPAEAGTAGCGGQQRRIPGMGRVNWQEVVKALL
jgi:sugar phosphate isomerase/epimerase